MTSAARRALVAAAALCALASCKSKSKSESAPSGPKRPAAISAPERKRGADACTAYVQRLCECAKTHPELAGDCQLKQAKPEALALALSVDDDATADRLSILQAQKEARTIIAACIEEDAALRGCP